MSPSDMLKLNEQQRRNFESWQRDLEALRTVVPAEQVEASGHRDGLKQDQTTEKEVSA